MNEKWESMPISPTCEVIVGKNKRGYKFCGKPTTKVYPTPGKGYMALCRTHGRKHPEAWPIQEVDERMARS